MEITPPAPSEVISVEDFMNELEAHAGDSYCGYGDAGFRYTVDGNGSASQNRDAGLSLSETHSEDPSVLNLSGDICVTSTVGAGSTSIGGG